VTFDEKNYDKILAITSQEGETVQLKQHVMAAVSARQLSSFVFAEQRIENSILRLFLCFLLSMKQHSVAYSFINKIGRTQLTAEIKN